MERSAEWLRGCLHAIDDLPGMQEHLRLEWINRRIEIYKAELAAAEAREANQPTAAEVIAACEKSLGGLRSWAGCAIEDAEASEQYKQSGYALALVARWKEANHAK